MDYGLKGEATRLTIWLRFNSSKIHELHHANETVHRKIHTLEFSKEKFEAIRWMTWLGVAMKGVSSYEMLWGGA